MSYRVAAYVVGQLAILLAPRMDAQSKPGTNVDVDVTVKDATRTAGDLKVSYIVRSRPTSSERVFEIGIAVPQGVQAVGVGASTDRWLAMSGYRGASVAQWAALGDEMQPGDSSPVLSYSAPGVLGIATGWVRGYVPVAPLPPEDTTNRTFHPEADPRFSQSKPIQLIGIVPAPAGGASEALAFVSGQLDYSCGSAGWISPAGICNSLSQKLAAASASLARGDTTAAKNQLGAFQHELDAQRGKHVSDNAYWLLKTNADYVLMHL